MHPALSVALVSLLALAAPAGAVSLYAPGDVLFGRGDEIHRVNPTTGDTQLIAKGDLLVGVQALALDADGSIFASVTTDPSPIQGVRRIVRIDGDTGDQSLFFEQGRDFGFFDGLERIGGTLWATSNFLSGSSSFILAFDIETGDLIFELEPRILFGRTPRDIVARNEQELWLPGALWIHSFETTTGFLTMEQVYADRIVMDDAVFLEEELYLTIPGAGVARVADNGALTYIALNTGDAYFQLEVLPDGRLATIREDELIALDPTSGAQSMIVALGSRGPILAVPVPAPGVTLFLLLGFARLLRARVRARGAPVH